MGISGKNLESRPRKTTKEPLIYSTMSLIADKKGVLAATRYCAAADCTKSTQSAIRLAGCGLVSGSSRRQPIPHRSFAHRVLAVVFIAPRYGGAMASGETTSHSTTLPKYSSQVAGYGASVGAAAFPAPKARTHRVMPPTPQSRVRGRVGIDQWFPKDYVP